MFFSGGLAQRVKQRTRRSVKYQEISPCKTQAVVEIEVFLELKQPAHLSTPHIKKATTMSGFFIY